MPDTFPKGTPCNSLGSRRLFPKSTAKLQIFFENTKHILLYKPVFCYFAGSCLLLYQPVFFKAGDDMLGIGECFGALDAVALHEELCRILDLK